MLKIDENLKENFLNYLEDMKKFENYYQNSYEK